MMMHGLPEKARTQSGGIGKGLGIGCAAITAALVIAIVMILRWLVAAGSVAPAERFITSDCKGFLIVRIRPDDAGVKAFLEGHEEKFQGELQKDASKRPPWIFRRVFGETPSQMWRTFMPVQMVWTVRRKPGQDQPGLLCVFSLARGKGMFSVFHKQLMQKAKGAEPSGDYKGRRIIFLKDVSPGESPDKSPPEGKGGKGDAETPEPPAAQPELLKIPKAAVYPWVTCFETTLMEANSFEELKNGIDLAADAGAKFAGTDFIKTAHAGFSDKAEVIGAVTGEDETAKAVLLGLFSFITGEAEKDIEARLQLQSIRTLSGSVDVVEADRARIGFTIGCEDEKSAQALHSALAVELARLRDGKKIEALAHSTDGASVTIGFEVTDLDRFSREEKGAQKEAGEKKEEKKKQKEEKNEPAKANPDRDH